MGRRKVSHGRCVSKQFYKFDKNCSGKTTNDIDFCVIYAYNENMIKIHAFL